MKKALLIISAAAVCFMPLRAEASGLSILKKAASSILTGAQAAQQNTVSASSSKLEALNNSLKETDAKVQNNFLSIVSLLSSKQEADTIQSKISQIASDAQTSETDKSVLISNLISSYASSLAADSSTSASSIISNLTKSEKASLSNTIKSLTESGKTYASLAKKYTALTQAASSVSELAETASAVKQAVSSIKSRTTAAANLVSAVSQLMK